MFKIRLMPKTINAKPPSYIWQHPTWPALTFDSPALMQDLSNARLEQGNPSFATVVKVMKALGLQFNVGAGTVQR